MVLRMACSAKRPGSDNWYFRRRVPTDIQAILAKMPKAQRPRNWYAKHLSISLKTADRAVAKTKCPEIAAEVERQLEALREGPKALTPKQISALSGIAYRAFAQGLEDNPGQRQKAGSELQRQTTTPNEATLSSSPRTIQSGVSTLWSSASVHWLMLH